MDLYSALSWTHL